MKRFSFFFALALLVFSFGLANAVSIDYTMSATWDDGGVTKIIPGQQVNFDMSLNNTGGVAEGGITNGYVVTVDGVGYSSVDGELIDANLPAMFDLTGFGTDLSGQAVGIIGFGGAQLTGGGLPADYNQPSYRVLGPTLTVGQEICIDKSFYGTAGDWVWGTSGSLPDFVTACFTAEDPPCALALTNCPGDLGSYIVEDVITYDLDYTADYGFCVPVWNVVSGNATVDANGVVTIIAEEGTFDIVVSASIGADVQECTLSYTAVGKVLTIGCVGDQHDGGFVYLGSHVYVPVTGQPLFGFDLLISYDASVLNFIEAKRGDNSSIAAWEYFTYRTEGNCGSGCPSGIVRINAIADMNNGVSSIAGQEYGELFYLDFLVTTDRNFECQLVPIQFYWMDCADNGLANELGDELYVSSAVTDYNGADLTDDMDQNDVTYPTFTGYQGDCTYDEKGAVISDYTFQNGCVWIACADSVDDRGDINLNDLAYEIGDAVLLSNYFIDGPSVLDDNEERMNAQMFASDVNADGLMLSVADLVYLIRVVVGDAMPIQKLAPVAATVSDNNGILAVNGDMGAAFVVVNGNATPTLLADNMTMEYSYDASNNTTRVLVSSLDGNSFNGAFLNTNSEVVSVELGSIEGATVVSKLVPANFELAQNYPNPFNPNTTIGFSLPVNSDVTLTIYNITGQKVNEISGNFEAGVHSIDWDASNNASGVYFYKLNADNFSETKKMVLMK